MKRFITVFLCMILASLLLFASCAPASGGDETTTTLGGSENGEPNADDPITLNISGKEAAELLLTRDRLREEAISGELNFLPSSSGTTPLGSLIQSWTSLTPAIPLGETVELSETVELDDGYGKFNKNGNTWEWSAFPEHSDDINFYVGYVNNIQSKAQGFADIIHNIKTKVNITDKWIRTGFGECLLTVGEISETVYERYSNGGFSVCNHYVDERGRDVYEMYDYIPHENGDLGKIYMIYIDGEHYEFAYDFIPADGAPEKYFRPRVIVENSRGYWNMLCLSEAEAMDVAPKRVNLSNLISKDGVVYSVDTVLTPGVPLAESDYNISIISEDWKNDIVSFSSNAGVLGINLSAFEGIEGLLIKDTASSFGWHEKLDPFGDGEKYAYMASGDLSLVLTDGTVINMGDQLLRGKLYYSSGYTRIFYPEGEPHGTVGYAGEASFGISDYHAGEKLTPNDLSDLLSKLFAELKITPKNGMKPIINTMEVASAFTGVFGEYYEWNGYKADSAESLIAANEDYVKGFENFHEAFEEAQKLPTVNLNDYKEPLPERLDFADFSGFSYGKITVSEGTVTAEEMIATLPEHVLFDEGSEYVLRLGLRKYGDDGESLTETIVIMHGAQETKSKFEAGKAIVFTQGSDYKIPENLSEGKYLLVAFVATADEGIRVSKTVPVASVDFESGTVESEVADITYEKTNDGTLVVISLSKLYTEVALSFETRPDLASVSDVLNIAALANGNTVDGAMVEMYDFESGIATPIEDGTALVAGTYRLKYRSPSGGGSDAYVFCTVTDEMLTLPEAEKTDDTSGDSTEAPPEETTA